MPRLKIFVDTSAFVALLRRDDAHHADADRIQQRLKAERVGLVTTNFVVAETHALLLRHLGGAAAREFLTEIDGGHMAVLVRAEPDDEVGARATIYRQTDKDYSLCDAISFAVMTRLDLRQAWAFDKHFGQYGWEMLAP